MSTYKIDPRGDGRFLAVRALPDNAEDIENLFGDRVRKVDDCPDCDWEIQPHGRYGVQSVREGDWIVLTSHDHIVRYAPEKFEATYIVLESIFDLGELTGEDGQGRLP